VLVIFYLIVPIKRDHLSYNAALALQKWVAIYVRDYCILYIMLIYNRKGGNDSPYVPKSRLFWGQFGSRYVEAAYDTNDMTLIF